MIKQLHGSEPDDPGSLRRATFLLCVVPTRPVPSTEHASLWAAAYSDHFIESLACLAVGLEDNFRRRCRRKATPMFNVAVTSFVLI